MAAKDLKVTTYKFLRHPELDTPVLAVEWLGYWKVAGKAVGLIVRYPGEDEARHLKFEEVRGLEGE